MQQLMRLLDVMAQLRHPEQGCPWDLQQDYKSLVPYTLEEAYEVAEAIELGDMEELKKELGDLLFQIVFYAQLAKEEGTFDFEAVAEAIADKMISRHPHVFADQHYENEAAFLKAWEQQKEIEKNNKQQQTVISLMDGVSSALPAMTRACKLQKKASHIGFDWLSAQDVVDKVREELDELSEELQHYSNETPENMPDRKSMQRIEEELGDVLFSCVNLSRKLQLDPEKTLRMSNHKFSVRFKKLEQYYAFNRQQMEQASTEQLDRVWQMIKYNE